MIIPNQTLNMNKEKVYKIYKISFPSKKVYIGQTYDIKKRWREHLTDTIKEDFKISRALRKYKTTIDCFEVIEDNILTQEEANAREIYWISFYDSYKNGYNSTIGGSKNFQPRGENHIRAILNDVELLELRKLRASKKYTFNQIYEFYKDDMSYSGLEKLWNYESRKDIGTEYNTPELLEFYIKDHRQCIGETHGNSKLTNEQVIDIRNRYYVKGDKTSEIYEDYKNLYSLSGFRKIISGETYSNIPIPEKSNKCKKKQSKLSKEDIIYIRKLYNEDHLKIMDIIRTYYPDKMESVISNIVHNRTYKNI